MGGLVYSKEGVPENAVSAPKLTYFFGSFI